MGFTCSTAIGSDLLNAIEEAASIRNPRVGRTDCLRAVTHAETVKRCVMPGDYLVDPDVPLVGRLCGDGIGQIVIANATGIWGRIEFNEGTAERVHARRWNNIARRAGDIAKGNTAESAAAPSRTRLG